MSKQTNTRTDTNLQTLVLTLLRVILGWKLIISAYGFASPKVTVAGYLNHAVSPENPLTGLWSVFAGMPGIELLIPLGLAAAGIALLTGTLVRVTVLPASFMMFMFYLSHLPMQKAIVVDYHIIYIVCFALLAAYDAGKNYGLDAYLADLDVVKNNSTLSTLLP